MYLWGFIEENYFIYSYYSNDFLNFFDNFLVGEVKKMVHL